MFITTEGEAPEQKVVREEYYRMDVELEIHWRKRRPQQSTNKALESDIVSTFRPSIDAKSDSEKNEDSEGELKEKNKTECFDVNKNRRELIGLSTQPGESKSFFFEKSSTSDPKSRKVL